MSEQTITIVDNWKTQERLQLIKNAAQGLVEVGVMPKSTRLAIDKAVDRELTNS